MTHAFAVAAALLVFGVGATAYSQTPAPPNKSVGSVPTSYELIDKARQRKEITEEQAYTYHIFAAFGDSRLPERFFGTNQGAGEPSPVVVDALSRVKTFSQATQTLLAPFLKRPASTGSWVSLSTIGKRGAPAPEREDLDGSDEPDAGISEPNDDSPGSERSQDPEWRTISAVGGKVKVWYQTRYAGDDAKAQRIASEMTSTIWPKLVGLFWEPVDDGYTYDNGGGPAFDIYLVRVDFSERNEAYLVREFRTKESWKGYAQLADWGRKCGESPRYLLIDSRHPINGARSVGLLQVVAHEFMHAIAYAKPLKEPGCNQFHWISEATATWAEDWTYPRVQSEQERARHFLANPLLSLDELNGDANTIDPRMYGAYLLPFYLANQGKQQALPEMWRQFATRDVLNGIDAALRAEGTELQETWPKFAVQNWNRPSVDDYKQGDDLADGARRTDSIKVVSTGGSVFQHRIRTGIHYLAARYSFFDVDASVRTITFENTLQGVSFASVWILENIKGTWQKPVDLSRKAGKTWCRDLAEEDLEDLVVIITNDQWQNKQLQVNAGPNGPEVRGFSHGCGGWVGTSTAENTMTSSDPAITIVEKADATLRFQIDSSFIRPGQPLQYWKIVGGQIQWSVTVTGKCTGSGSGVQPITDLGPGEEMATLQVWEEGGTLRFSGSTGPWPGDMPTYTMNCPNQPPVTQPFLTALGWFGTDLNNNKVTQNGKLISGSYTSSPAPGSGITNKMRYSLRLVP